MDSGDEVLGDGLMKIHFLFGRIVSGQFSVKVDEITEKYGLPRAKISNDVVVQHIQNFSKTDENGYSFYSGYFSKILDKKIYSPEPTQDEVELPQQGVFEGGIYIRLVFDFSETKNITEEDIEVIKSKFPKDFESTLGLSFLDVR